MSQRITAPGKYLSRKILAWGVRCGALKRAHACQKCGSTDWINEGHHEDYSKPLRVVWLCIPCHRHYRGNSNDVPSERINQMEEFWEVVRNIELSCNFEQMAWRFMAARELGLPNECPLPYYTNESKVMVTIYLTQWPLKGHDGKGA